MQNTSPTPWDIYEEHLDEAAFLWLQWERAMDAAHYTLSDVIAGPEERLRAHLDGLILGGKPVAERLLLPALTDDDEGKVAAAAWALLHSEDDDRLELVFEALVKAEKKGARLALTRAFELAERTDLIGHLQPRLEASVPSVQAMVIGVLRARQPGQPPVWGFPIERYLESRHQDLLVSALRALCRAPDPLQAPLVEKLLASPYVAVRDAAIETGLRMGLRAAFTACSKLVARNAAGTRWPLAVLAAGGQPVDLAVIIRKLDVESMRRDAVWALGFAGTAAAAEAALAWIHDDELAPVAAESFATITGARITGPLAEVGRTDNSLPPEVGGEGDEDALPGVTAADSLPSPNAERLLGWWEKAEPRFAPDARYLFGQPLSPEVLRSALASGPTWRRRVWAVAFANPGQADIDLRMWGRRQAGPV